VGTVGDGEAPASGKLLGHHGGDHLGEVQTAVLLRDLNGKKPELPRLAHQGHVELKLPVLHPLQEGKHLLLHEGTGGPGDLLDALVKVLRGVDPLRDLQKPAAAFLPELFFLGHGSPP